MTKDQRTSLALLLFFLAAAEIMMHAEPNPFNNAVFILAYVGAIVIGFWFITSDKEDK